MSKKGLSLRVLPRAPYRVTCAALELLLLTNLIFGAQASAEPPLGEPVNLYAPNADVYAVHQGGPIYALHAHGQVWLLAGEPGESNVAVQIGDEGIVVVDTGARAAAPRLLEQILRLAEQTSGPRKSIHMIVNTNGHADHIGGNQVVREGGNQLIAGEMQQQANFVPEGAEVLANQNVLSRLVAEGNADRGLWPTDAEDFDVYGLYFNMEGLQLVHPHNANTDGQLIVYFRQSDVIAAGDVMDMTRYPVIDVAQGGSIDGELIALNELIDMAIPAHSAEGGTVIIPGHGRLCDQSDAEFYKNMITTIRNRVQFYKDEGKSLEQVLALQPSAGWDERWGSDTGQWTTRDFISAVYNTLPARGPAIFSMQGGTFVPSDAAVSNGRLF